MGKTLKMKRLDDLVLGGATFNTQYNDDPYMIDIDELLTYALDNGIYTIDTSPYYGPSETIIGKAIKRLGIKREDIMICTKAGRIAIDKFDYSRKHIRFSVMRSIERLNAQGYLDIVYLHDVEFVNKEDSFDALKELELLKSEGYIRKIGISGYPLQYLYELASTSPTKLDCILSYCNLNLQNTRLDDFYSLFQKLNISRISNASILSMSLLREQETRSFHPSSQDLRACADKAALYCRCHDEQLACVAQRYAFSKWYCKGPTIIGISSLSELKDAIAEYKSIDQTNGNLSTKDQVLVKHIQTEIFNTHFNECWPSGNH